MKTCARAFLVVLAIAFSATAAAKNFRWAAQSDASTVDPHANNELFTNALATIVFDSLTMYDDKLNLVPGLATAWKNTSPTTWLVTLRKGVKWHDGSDFTADDVLFSFERARLSGSSFKLYSTQVGVPRKIDDHTVEFVTPQPNPVLPIGLVTIFIMNRKWCEEHNVTRPQDYTNKEETYSSRNAMGTGPYKLVSYQAGIKTLLAKNTGWWGIKEGLYTGNVDTIDYRPIVNPATRMAALRSGEVDFVLDPSVQDVPRMKTDAALTVLEGDELRVMMIGLDQARGELLYSDLKGKNPFKDKRVRLALYQAVDINALKTQVMRGLSAPTGIPLPSPKGAGVPASYEKRLPYDLAAARRLLAEAGYPNGFGFTLHCPNDRYVNDEKICIALSSMWAKLGLAVKVETMPKTQFFQKVQKKDVSAYLVGWGGAVQDAIFTLKPLMHSPTGKGPGDDNYGGFSNAELDKLIDGADQEMDPVKRQALIDHAVKIVQDEVLVIPLHRQVIPWVSRAGVKVIHRANNVLLPYTVKMP